MFVEHSNIQFYDYTKNPHRMQKFLDGTDWPWNYHLAFSLSENFNNQAHAYSFIRQGGQIAVVFKNESAPQYGLPNHEDELFDVINGDIDQSDLPMSLRGGLAECLDKLEGVEGVGVCKLTSDDIIRNDVIARILSKLSND